jgi:hypothetical protein
MKEDNVAQDLIEDLNAGMPPGCSMEFAAGYRAACSVVAEKINKMIDRHDDKSGDLFHHPV